MGILIPYDDSTGQLDVDAINAQNVTNVITELNRSYDQLDSLNKAFSINAILNVSYTVTIADLSANFAHISFPHGLNLAPQVIGSVVNTADSVRRILPVYWKGNQSYFGLLRPSASIIIESSDITNVNLRFDINDIQGATWITLNNVLNFKLYCLQESVAI